jgi:DNA primase
MSEETIVDDRRAAIEAAFESVDTGTSEVKPVESPSAPTAPETPPENTSSQAVAAPESAERDPAATTPQTGADESVDTAPKFSVDKAPQSWRGPQKAKWASLDPEVRQEVIRREREITKTLSDTAQVRQFAQQFSQTIQPFQARLQSSGVNPVQAVQKLLESDHVLSSAPKAQRAQFMAKLITDYGIDILELDAALAGKAPVDPVQSQVDQLLQQRLAPFQQYIARQEQERQLAVQQENNRISHTVESMSTDPKYPHFDTVRQDMADVVELSAKKGVYLSLEQAYTRAIAMNPEINQQVTNQQQVDAKKSAAQAAHARAQKALQASKSVGGAPSGMLSGTSGVSDRRSAIVAAFDAVGGR